MRQGADPHHVQDLLDRFGERTPEEIAELLTEDMPAGHLVETYFAIILARVVAETKPT